MQNIAAWILKSPVIQFIFSIQFLLIWLPFAILLPLSMYIKKIILRRQKLQLKFPLDAGIGFIQILVYIVSLVGFSVLFHQLLDDTIGKLLIQVTSAIFAYIAAKIAYSIWPVHPQKVVFGLSIVGIVTLIGGYMIIYILWRVIQLFLLTL